MSDENEYDYQRVPGTYVRTIQVRYQYGGKGMPPSYTPNEVLYCPLTDDEIDHLRASAQGIYDDFEVDYLSSKGETIMMTILRLLATIEHQKRLRELAEAERIAFQRMFMDLQRELTAAKEDVCANTVQN